MGRANVVRRSASPRRSAIPARAPPGEVPGRQSLSPALAEHLQASGHEAVHVRDYGLHAAPDEVVLQRARDEERVLLTADTDFGALLARKHTDRPSVLLLRRVTPRRAPD